MSLLYCCYLYFLKYTPNLAPDNKPKGSDLGQLIRGDSAAKKGNNDNSPSPPPCPKDNSNIPPIYLITSSWL